MGKTNSRVNKYGAALTKALKAIGSGIHKLLAPVVIVFTSGLAAIGYLAVIGSVTQVTIFTVLRATIISSAAAALMTIYFVQSMRGEEEVYTISR